MSNSQTTPTLADSLNRRLLAASQLQIPEAPESEDEHSPEDSLLNDLADDIEANAHDIARKEPSFNGALTLLVLAILIDLAGRL